MLTRRRATVIAAIVGTVLMTVSPPAWAAGGGPTVTGGNGGYGGGGGSQVNTQITDPDKTGTGKVIIPPVSLTQLGSGGAGTGATTTPWWSLIPATTCSAR